MTAFDETGFESDYPFNNGESDFGAGFDEASEFDNGEASRPTPAQRQRAMLAARNRALQQQRLQQQRRFGGMSGPPPRPVPGQPPQVAAEVRKTQAALQNVDLDTKVRFDAAQGAMQTQSRRISGSENAIAVGTAVAAAHFAFGSTPLLKNPFIKFGSLLAPLAFIREAKAPWYKSSRLWAIGGVSAIGIGGEVANRCAMNKKSGRVGQITILHSPPQPRPGGQFSLNAIAKDLEGNIVTGTVPTLKVKGATENPDQPGFYTVDASVAEVSIVATAAGTTAPWVIPVTK